MWPLGEGMSVRVRSNVEVIVGDLVVFIHSDGISVFAHRVIARTASGLQTRGDTNRRADTFVPNDAVIGRVEAIRWGQLRLPLPRRGTLAVLQRRLGISWSTIAPSLRAGWHRIRKV